MVHQGECPSRSEPLARVNHIVETLFFVPAIQVLFQAFASFLVLFKKLYLYSVPVGLAATSVLALLCCYEFVSPGYVSRLKLRRWLQQLIQSPTFFVV